MISSSLAVATKKDLNHDESTCQALMTKVSLYELVLVLCPEGQKALVEGKGLAFSSTTSYALQWCLSLQIERLNQVVYAGGWEENEHSSAADAWRVALVACGPPYY
jgi:hypothetical protein